MRTISNDSWTMIDTIKESQIKGDPNDPTCLSQDQLKKFHEQFHSMSNLKLAMNTITRNEISTAIVNRDLLLDTYHVFSNRREPDIKVTNQKSSGRCWLFAATNILRVELMKRYNLGDEFEFSQAYLCWCDKLEKANWFLESIIKTAKEDLDGRLVKHLLCAPMQDGGQWDMAVNLIKKYGLCPKGIFPESAHSSNTNQLNWLLTAKLREFALQLRELHAKGHQEKELRAIKPEMLGQIYNILTVAFGSPPIRFDWNFRDKDKKFHSFPNLTPQTFLKEHVGLELERFVSLVHDPRHEYNRLFTVDYLGNVEEGQSVLYLNLPIEELKKYTSQAVQDGKSVWFGCDVGKFSHRQQGIMDLNLYDYEGAFGVRFGLNKADRLRYGESSMTHAMAICGVHLEDKEHGSRGPVDSDKCSENSKKEKEKDKKEKMIDKDFIPVRWRVENSWGEDNGEKGYFSMTDSWFSEYVYQVVIDKEALSEEQRSILQQKPQVLPPWDPLGALASN